MLAPDDADLADVVQAARCAAAAAFGAALPDPDALALAAERVDLVAGRISRVLVTGPAGPVAAGSAQAAGGVVELVGIGTAAGVRGRGIGAALTTLLIAHVRATGADVVFVAAESEAAVRLYEPVGFRRIGACGLAEPAPR